MYEAFPRLEEVFFKSGHSSQYVIQLFTEHEGELVHIKRVGPNAYHVLTRKPDSKLIKQISREEVLRLQDCITFEH